MMVDTFDNSRSKCWRVACIRTLCRGSWRLTWLQQRAIKRLASVTVHVMQKIRRQNLDGRCSFVMF